MVSRSRCASFSNWRTRERWGSVSVSFVVPKFVLIMDFSYGGRCQTRVTIAKDNLARTSMSRSFPL